MSGLLRTGLLATAAAVATTALVAALLSALGVPLVLRGEDESIPVVGVAFVTGFFCLAGVAIAAVCRWWSRRPDIVWTRATVALVVVSLLPPVLAAPSATTAVALVTLHVVPAAVMVPTLARSLRGRARQGGVSSES